MYCYVFEYRIRPGREGKFESLYGGDGAWVKLFARDPEYLGTELWRDVADSRRFVTIDRWTSRAACLSFRERSRDEFDAIDAAGGELTESERDLGAFELAS